MGRPTRPGVLGAIHDAVDAIRKTYGPGAEGPGSSPGEGKGGAERASQIDVAVDAASGGGDSVAGDESNHSSTVASNAGSQAQSTDHQNKY